ncbi:MAG: sporulation protein YunB [Clostridia bacterium]|nr:sporulation protein YunB [Clostridia bacterium]
MKRRRIESVRTRKLVRRIRQKGRSGLSGALGIGIAAGLVFALLLGTESFLERHYAEEILALAASEVQNRAVAEANRLVCTYVEETDLSYEDVFHFDRRGDGTILACRTDTALVNRLGAKIAGGLDEYFQNEGSEVGIPLGNLLGTGFFYARGPKVGYRVLPIGRIACDYESVFASAGINQTIHRLSFRVTILVAVMGAGGRENVEITGSFPVAEAVLIGSIPEYYAEGQGGDG